MFVIRADGNAKIGAGHLMRCLTIATAVKEMADAPEILVLCADEESAEVAVNKGFRTGVFHTDYRRMEEEIPYWSQWLKDAKNTILVDSYYVTDAYLTALKAFGRVCLMDDMQNRVFPVDAVINYNVFADEAFYSQWPGVQSYLGGTYAPLRPQFKNMDYSVKNTVKHVLITTGAGDADNIAGVILERIYREDVIFHVLVGRFSPHLSEWQNKAQNVSNIQVHFDVQNMAELMSQCDLAITAGGSTVYELSAVGVPFICFAYATNQELLVKYLGENDVAGSAGNWHVDKSRTLENLEFLFEHFFADYVLREKYAKRAHAMLDGLGAERLARALCRREADS